MREQTSSRKYHAKNCTKVKYNDNDSYRMSQLGEEVIGRIEEMWHIVARNLGKPNSPVRFTTLNLGPTDKPVIQMQFFSTPPAEGEVDIDGEILLGCHDPVSKECCEGPCPC